MSQQAKDELDETIKRIFNETQAALPEEDRADPDGDYCMADNEHQVCTKTKGHKSEEHIAHGTLGYVLHRWK